MDIDAPHGRRGRLEPTPGDEELAGMAQSMLISNRALPLGAVNARVVGGWLTLSGEVQWHYQRQDALEWVRHLPGVVGISNHITLCSPSKVAPG